MIDEFWLCLGSLYLWFHTSWDDRQQQEFNELVVLGVVFIVFPLVIYVFFLPYRAEIAQRQAHKNQMDRLVNIKK